MKDAEFRHGSTGWGISTQIPWVVTFVYPEATPFLSAFVRDCNAQVGSDFGVLIINDGHPDIQRFVGELHMPHAVIPAEPLSPQGIRFWALRLLRDDGSDILIFQDSDDGMSPNRVQEVVEALREENLVVNDLDLTDTDGSVFKKNIWESRFRESPRFGAGAVKEFNILGFGNTAIRRELLKWLPPEPEESLIAVDWYIFSGLMLGTGTEGLFLSACTTRYRQHASNAAGLMGRTAAKKALQVRRAHQKALYQAGLSAESSIGGLRQKASESGFHLFWWEETQHDERDTAGIEDGPQF